jgi:iron complex outermembrane recepter protein
MTSRRPASRTAPWLALLASSAVIAQQAEPTSTPAGEVEEVVVTGSRIARPDYSSTSPIVTFGQEQITQTGTVNIENALNQLPQFVQGQMQSTIGAVALAGRADWVKRATWCCSMAGACHCRMRMRSWT